MLLECLECLSCVIECTVRLYDMHPFVIASSSASTRQFECKYSQVRVRILASSRASASIHTRNLAHACALTITRLSRNHSFAILACSFACHASRSHSFVNLRLSGTVSEPNSTYVNFFVPYSTSSEPQANLDSTSSEPLANLNCTSGKLYANLHSTSSEL